MKVIDRSRRLSPQLPRVPRSFRFPPHTRSALWFQENNLIFYECSACSGHNTKESLLHLAR